MKNGLPDLKNLESSAEKRNKQIQKLSQENNDLRIRAEKAESLCSYSASQRSRMLMLLADLVEVEDGEDPEEVYDQKMDAIMKRARIIVGENKKLLEALKSRKENT